VRKIEKIPFAHQTMFAELSARAMDADFDEQFPENGSFVRMASKGRSYWYYSKYTPNSVSPGPGSRSKIYVGPVDDPDITARVESFADIKVNYRERRKMVQSLVAAGLPSPTGLVGDITEALWKAGFFRLRSIVIGTLAFQTYGGYLGVNMPNASLMTGDADFAQFHSISYAVDDAMPSILDVLCAVDPTFQAVPHLGSKALSTKFRNATRFEVEFLTPNRGSDGNQGKPAPMPALGGAGAQPLRFLDFLIYGPVRSVLLHKAGIPVTVPAPERYAIHKLIVSSQRKDDDNGRQKARKDIMQAELLIEALKLERRLTDIGLAWTEAWSLGPQWKTALSKARSQMETEAADLLRQAVAAACGEDGMAVGEFGYPE